MGGGVLLATCGWRDADYRLSIFPQIEKCNAGVGGVLWEKNFFILINLFCLGITIPEFIFNFGLRSEFIFNSEKRSRVYFQFRITRVDFREK